MGIELDYSGRGTTCSVLKWIAVGVALRALVFCVDEVVAQLFFHFLHCLWLLAGRQRKRWFL